ncbi:MAG: TolC family protein [Ignavibacteriae bacterium]|nr:TolC family protein [Ignavibacteriota bacterium]
MKQNIATLFIFSFTFLFFIQQLSAQQAATLSLEQSISLGLENSKSLHSSLMKVQAATAKSSETNASRLPQLKFGGTYTRLSEIPSAELTVPYLPAPNNKFVISPSIFDNYNLKLTLQQPIFIGFKIESGAEMAEYNAYAIEQDYQKDKTELIYNIKSAYWNLFKAKQFKKVIDENIAQVQSHLKDVENMMNQGLATNNDVLKVQVQLSNVQLMQLEAANGVQLATLNLNYLIGKPLNSEIELSSSPSPGKQQAKEFDLEKLTERAFASRSELKGMEYRIKASEAAVTFARANWYPQIFLVGNYNYARPNQRIFPTVDEFRDTWDASIAVSFDVWNWGQTSNQSQQAQAQLQQAQDGMSQLRDGITMEVTSNYLNLKKAGESIGLAEKGVKQAEENYRITNDKFKAGITSNSDLLDAEVALLQAKTNYTNSLVDHELALARLQKSVGETK